MKYLPKNKWLRTVVLAIATVFSAGGILMIATCSAVGATPRGVQLDTIKQSPNYRDGRFVNKLPMTKPEFFKTMKEWMKSGDNTTPTEALPVVQRQKTDFETSPASGLRITWIGHSTSLVEIDGARVLLDPVWSDRTSPISWVGPKRFSSTPLALEDLPVIDVVLISHDHFDHLDKSTVTKLAKGGVKFIVPLGVGARMQGWDIPSNQITELDWWDAIEVGSLTITATPARHFSGRSLAMTDRDKTLWAGFSIHGPKHRVYYSGDSGMFEGFKEIGERLGPFDAALIEVGAYNKLWADLHLGPEQALQAFEQVRGGILVPVHWATFNLAMHSWTEPAERLMAEAEKTGASFVLPRPGQSVEPSNPPEVERWWPEIPWETVSQHPIISSGL
jgi:L-ascorbate metabolism protein UlaG (beta-lactamase superfamily)